MRRVLGCVIALLLASLASAQQGAARGAPLVIRTQSLPNGRVHQSYQFALQAEGGILPLKWTLVSGDLPPGMKLGSDGILRGAPNNAGDFSFVVQVEDNAKPQNQRSQPFNLKVITPLLVEWLRPPHVNGQRVEGAIKVTNGTDQDFDLTAIIVAVNDYGRATALGYQHFTLRAGTNDFAIPFGQSLPHGSYGVHADAVAEIAAKNQILKRMLETPAPLPVTQGP